MAAEVPPDFEKIWENTPRTKATPTDNPAWTVVTVCRVGGVVGVVAEVTPIGVSTVIPLASLTEWALPTPAKRSIPLIGSKLIAPRAFPNDVTEVPT